MRCSDRFAFANPLPPAMARLVHRDGGEIVSFGRHIEFIFGVGATATGRMTALDKTTSETAAWSNNLLIHAAFEFYRSLLIEDREVLEWRRVFESSQQPLYSVTWYSVRRIGNFDIYPGLIGIGQP